MNDVLRIDKDKVCLANSVRPLLGEINSNEQMHILSSLKNTIIFIHFNQSFVYIREIA